MSDLKYNGVTTEANPIQILFPKFYYNIPQRCRYQCAVAPQGTGCIR